MTKDQDFARDKAELERCLAEFDRLMHDPVALAGMLLESLEAMRNVGQLPAPKS